MHRVTEFAPNLTIGGSASRRGHVALALADTGAPYDDALADWEHVVVYYAAIRSEGSGRVRRPARPAVAARHLLAHRRRPEPPGPRPRPPRRGAARRRGHRAVPVGRRRHGRPPRSTSWAPGGTRSPAARTNLMTVHLTSTVRMGEDRAPHRRRQLRPGVGLPRTCGSTTRRCCPTPRASTRRRRSWPSPPATPTSSWPRHDPPPARGAGPAAARRPASPLQPRQVPVTDTVPSDVPMPDARRRPPSSPARPAGWARTWCGPSSAQRERVRCLVPVDDDAAPLALAVAGRRGRGRRRPRPRHRRPALRRRRRRRRGRSTPPRSSTRPRSTREFFDVNVGGTQLVLDRARRAGAAGSCTCRRTRRSAPTRRPTTGSPRTRPTTRTSGYGQSKHEAEQLVQQAHDRGDLPTVIVRPPWFYGPYQPRAADPVLPHRPPGPLPAGRRRHPAPLDGLHRQPGARPAPGRGGRQGARATPTGSPTPSPTSCARSWPPCAGARGRGPADVGARHAPRCPRAAARLAERVDALLQGRGPLPAGGPRARRAQGHDRLRHLAGPRRARLRADASRCTRACAPASAGASTTGSSSDEPAPSSSPAAAATSGRSSSTARWPGATGSASSTSTRRPTERGSTYVAGDVRDLRRRCARPATASTWCSTTSPRCRWPRTASCSGRSTSPAPPTCCSPPATRASPRSCTRRRAPSSASPSPTRSPRTRPGRPLEAYGRAKLEAEHAVPRRGRRRARRDDRPAPHDPRPRPARASWPSCSSSWPRAPPSSCSAAATTATSSCTPTTWPTPCLRAADREKPTTYNIGATEFGTMRETLQALVDHAGTGSRVRSLPAGAGPPRHAGPRHGRAGAVRAVPLAALRRVAVVRHHPGPAPSSAGSRSTPTRRWSIESYEWFLAHRGSLDGEHRSHHQSPVRLGLLKVLKRLP